MSGTTTAMATSYKAEAMRGIHNITAQVTPTGNTTNTNFTVTSLSSVSGIQRGMPLSGGGIPTGAVVASVDSSSQLTMSKAATATNSAETITINGDVLAMALIKNACTGTYGAASTNYSNVTGNSDEASGTGYTAGGYAWAASAITAVSTSGTTAFTTPSVNPSWTSATLDVQGAMIYNQTAAPENTTNRAVGVLDFGGEQKVNAGTLTILMPTNNSSTGLLRFQ